jgi:hypothetical protein
MHHRTWAVLLLGCAWILWSDHRWITEEPPTVRIRQEAIHAYPTHAECQRERRESLDLYAWVAETLRQDEKSGIVDVTMTGESVITYYKAGTRSGTRDPLGGEATVKEWHQGVECWPSDFDPRPNKPALQKVPRRRRG